MRRRSSPVAGSIRLRALGVVTATTSGAALLSACATTDATPGTTPVEHLQPEIIAVHPFDESSFTQGLEVIDGDLLVGTGQYGASRVYRSTVDGRELHSGELDPGYFGEGITRAGDILWQLTWTSGVALRRDAETLEPLGEVAFEGEGWGICHDGATLIMSDGSADLQFRDPETFGEVRERVQVHLDGSPVPDLNELECVDGEIYANVFLSTDILRINPTDGAVTAVIDASALPNNSRPDVNNVLNGIAHIPGTDRFYLSGKRWPDLYEVRFSTSG